MERGKVVHCFPSLVEELGSMIPCRYLGLLSRVDQVPEENIQVPRAYHWENHIGWVTFVNVEDICFGARAWVENHPGAGRLYSVLHGDLGAWNLDYVLHVCQHHNRQRPWDDAGEFVGTKSVDSALVRE